MVRATSRNLCLWLLALSPATALAEPQATPAIEQTCARCHALRPGDRSRWGPDLAGIFERSVGSEEGYRYGSYLREQGAQGATWTEQALRAWLVDSKAVARAADGRTKMPSQDLTEAQVEAVLSFLRTLK